MDILQLCKLTNLLIVYVFCTGYYTSGRLYRPGKLGDPGLRRNGEPPKAEGYISKLWQGAMARQIPEQSKSLVLTPKGSKGPAIIKLLPTFMKHPLTILNSGVDDDPMDLSSFNGKILNIPDPANGQISILKSPGHTSSILVTSRGGTSFNRGNKSFKKKLKNVQKKIAVNKQLQTGNNADRDGYIGTSFTGFLSETLCPLCRRLSNRRLRISCLLRYCIENPNISNGNPR